MDMVYKVIDPQVTSTRENCSTDWSKCMKTELHSFIVQLNLSMVHKENTC